MHKFLVFGDFINPYGEESDAQHIENVDQNASGKYEQQSSLPVFFESQNK